MTQDVQQSGGSLAPVPNSDEVIQLASDLLTSSRSMETSAERKRSALMARMMADANGKQFTMALADQVLRILDPKRAATRLQGLIGQFGLPKYLPLMDRLAIRIGNWAASVLPGTVMPMVTDRIRKNSQHVIVSSTPAVLDSYLQSRKNDGVRVNYNQLGEAVLGEREALRRLQESIDRLQQPEIDYVSIKLSAIASQISLTGYSQTLDLLRERLRKIYRTAIESKAANGSPKFVNLDMEEYKDLALTVSVFRSVLDEPEFETLEAGIVLQAYLPDSFKVQQALTKWAIERHARTGGRIKVRLVKGANLAMEKVDASLHGWPQTPFGTKTESDASFKRMLEYATRPEHASVVRVGVASHNLFDIALALLLRERRGVTQHVEFEMLEGMANAQALEIRKRSGGMVMYSPVVADEEFEAAVAYLVRRLDENTDEGSFLGAMFSLQEGSDEWNRQAAAFSAAMDLAQSENLADQPQRTQNRLTETPVPCGASDPFQNEPDTDFSLPANRQWASEILDRWTDKTIEDVPLCLVGSIESRTPTAPAADPSRPGVVPYRYAQASSDDVENALAAAVEAQTAWESRGFEERGKILRQVAAVIAQQRGDLIGAMTLDSGKAITEADVEISEAIDFANYYAMGCPDGSDDGAQSTPLGVVVVTPPWNFPFAIPVGGILAGLAAGNAVIFKPASETVLTGWVAVNCLWEAGVPKEALQFLPMEDGPVGKQLISDPRTDAVILTGSTQTAELFQSWRPDLRLFAETSGKNAMIITATADIDLAIKDLVQGAFGHAGQKCSATSLALVEAEVYDSPGFQQQLLDAAGSLKIGSAWNPSAKVTPVIRSPDPNLKRGLTQLDEGESWLLEPKMIDDNPCLWSPGIRLGVQPGSWYHQNECFGPVLGMIRVSNLDEAIRIQNSSRFGLTGGIHSLDPEEIADWRERVEVGNAYINRGTTGAIVQRQPFGGWKDSSVGPGVKAGGPNYVAAFREWSNDESPTTNPVNPGNKTVEALIGSLNKHLPADLHESMAKSVASYAHWWQSEFSIAHDPSQLHGQTNHFEYRPQPQHVLRFEQSGEVKPEDLLSVARVIAACQLTNCPLFISPDVKNDQIAAMLTEVSWAISAEARVESTEAFVEWLQQQRNGTLRIVGDYQPEQFAPSVIGNIFIVSPNVLSNGRIELLNYLREQAISEMVHRYGNLTRAAV